MHMSSGTSPIQEIRPGGAVRVALEIGAAARVAP